MRKWPSLRRIRPRVSPRQQAITVRQMLRRLLPPEKSQQFVIIVNSSLVEKGRDVFLIQNDPDGQRIQIHGSTGVAAAWGFQYYAKRYCGCHFSWSGNQVDTLTLPLPRLKVPVKVVANDLARYYQNVCTFSYSSVWWNWTRWEQEIDWMALNAINLPLAFDGQEEIMRRVYHRLGFSQKELDAFFAGPAFLAWGRMGNIDGWGGPLPPSFYTGQLKLQHKILKRMRGFGMVPVLPAFSGHVPQSIEDHFPNVTVRRLPSWNKFNETYSSTYLLDYKDPLFQTIGQNFLSEMKAEFGIDHVYNCDTFNEMEPSPADPDYVSGFGRAIFQAMTAVDHDAIWLMQGWLFNDPFWTTIMAEALVTSVPSGRMIVLDLQSELSPQYQRLESYFGQPWIWCMLHNFGGVKGLYGAVERVNNWPFEGRAFPNSTMIGTGLTPEGIEQNDVMYELMNEMAFLRTPVHVDDWFGDFANRRYGYINSNATLAWQTLAHTVFNCTSVKDHGQFVIAHRPSFLLDPHICYNTSAFIPAWDKMVEASQDATLAQSDLFQHDLVDVTREALVVAATNLYGNMTFAYLEQNLTSFVKNSSRLVDLLKDLNKLLGSDRRFLLGPWIQSAKDLAKNQNESTLYEYNARNQITLWGPNGEIVDYATKQWSGIVSDYYLPRWQLFIGEVTSCLLTGKNFSQSEFNKKVLQEVEKPFTFQKNVYPIHPTGDPISLAQQLYSKWKSTTNQQISVISHSRISLALQSTHFRSGDLS